MASSSNDNKTEAESIKQDDNSLQAQQINEQSLTKDLKKNRECKKYTKFMFFLINSFPFRSTRTKIRDTSISTTASRCWHYSYA